MKKNELNEGFNNIDPVIVEKFIQQKDALEKKSRQKASLHRFIAVAACLCLIVGGSVALYHALKPQTMPSVSTDATPPTNTDATPPVSADTTPSATPTETQPNSSIQNIPINTGETTESSPQYYGDESSAELPSGTTSELALRGINVIAKYADELPDTYTFYGDWTQTEFRIIKLRTVDNLQGKPMPEEFYYIIPVEFMTDYSIYDQFLILEMAQYGYENTVLYNKTKSNAAMLDLLLFGYQTYGGFCYMGSNFAAYDADGNFDGRLWESTDMWAKETNPAGTHQTIDVIAERAKAYNENVKKYTYAHSLKDVTGEATQALEYISSFENGIYAPMYINGLVADLYPEVQYHVTRFINGYATNEHISIMDTEYLAGHENMPQFISTYSEARFTDEDLDKLPNLASAMSAVSQAYDEGKINPPHITDFDGLHYRSYGIFGWYAKTENGVVGVIRISWTYTRNYVSNKDYYEPYKTSFFDDAYYIIEYGEDTCKAIDRDELLERIGEYEKSNIFTGKYDETGKVYVFDYFVT